MQVQVVLLPTQLAVQLAGRACAVFDVLRATTTMTAALAAGVKEIHLFGDLQGARRAAKAQATGLHLLCGEEACLRPAGFDLGNSPSQFTSAHRGATLFMCTTNGTRALLAAREAQIVLTGALVNASAVARMLARSGRDIVLLCAGTAGEVAMEDLIGAGAVIAALPSPTLENDLALMALRLFQASRANLRQALSETRGGRNVIAAGLAPDIDFAARLDCFDVVGIASGDPLVVRAMT